MKNRFAFTLVLAGFLISGCHAQKKIPAVHHNMSRARDGSLRLEWQGGRTALQAEMPARYTLEQMQGNPVGTETGIALDFQNPDFTGFLYYGFIHHDDGTYPQPVYFRDYEIIRGGKAHVDIRNKLSGRYDMIGWEQSGRGILGYRVLSEYGEFLYDGKIAFEGNGPFTAGITLVEGPFISLSESDRVIISFRTNQSCRAAVAVGEDSFGGRRASREHVIELGGLTPDTQYSYTISGVTLSGTFSFRTAPLPGSRTSFTFAYASDSRDGMGGGERNFRGVNAYIMKKIMALTRQQDARFFQFTGDLITGYNTDLRAQDLEYANWKRAVEPYWHHIPLYVGMGNHESLNYLFRDTLNDTPVQMTIDRFPYDTESSEALYARNFIMPENGPESEDGADYDPDPKKTDFPSYKESVFYYVYDNVGMIVLNSNYWYAPTEHFVRFSSGNIHGYIMDKQLEWLKNTLDMFEGDENIDHVFVTIHTPAFPNGGHVHDDMWYNGQNDWRPFVAGRPLGKGIIERRDEFIDLMANRSSKVVALLTGDEHNYNRLKITDDMERYPETWFLPRLEIKREIWQINNGAAGAPYYAQEQTPWSEHVIGFTTRNALVLIDVDGKRVALRVINPDTLEPIDEAILRE
jgi:hypothetical protein